MLPIVFVQRKVGLRLGLGSPLPDGYCRLRSIVQFRRVNALESDDDPALVDGRLSCVPDDRRVVEGTGDLRRCTGMGPECEGSGLDVHGDPGRIGVGGAGWPIVTGVNDTSFLEHAT